MKPFNQLRANLKNKLRTRQRVFAAWTSLAHPSISEVFSRIGIDFVGIDIEHSTINQEQSQRIITACQGSGTLCLPRIASHNMEMIKRLLDSGADGIIVPMISSAQEVQQLMEWCKYPSEGHRSYGIARAQGYGFDFDEYTQKWNCISSMIVQIESVEGVENINEILEFKEIDGVMVGPYDLSGSLGIPGKLKDPRVLEGSKKVIDACRQYGKACGTQIIEPDLKTVEKAFDEGYTFVVLASDVFLLWKWCQEMQGIVAQLKKAKVKR